jgi:predicted transcriptional regulator
MWKGRENDMAATLKIDKKTFDKIVMKLLQTPPVSRRKKCVGKRRKK